MSQANIGNFSPAYCDLLPQRCCGLLSPPSLLSETPLPVLKNGARTPTTDTLALTHLPNRAFHRAINKRFLSRPRRPRAQLTARLHSNTHPCVQTPTATLCAPQEPAPPQPVPRPKGA